MTEEDLWANIQVKIESIQFHKKEEENLAKGIWDWDKQISSTIQQNSKLFAEINSLKSQIETLNEILNKEKIDEET